MVYERPLLNAIETKVIGIGADGCGGGNYVYDPTRDCVTGDSASSGGCGSGGSPALDCSLSDCISNGNMASCQGEGATVCKQKALYGP